MNEKHKILLEFIFILSSMHVKIS